MNESLYGPPATGDRVRTHFTGREGTITSDSRGHLTITWDLGAGVDVLTYPQFGTSFDRIGEIWELIF